MITLTPKKAFAPIAILTVILCSGHAFQTLFPVLSWIVLPMAAAMLPFEMVKHRDLKLKKAQIVLLLFAIMVGVTCVVHLGAGATIYLSMMCYIFVGYSLSQLYSFKEIADCHVKIMSVTTVIAIIGYILVHNTSVMDALPLMSNVNDVEYRVGGIFNYIPLIDERNCGMFWEPGLFATHLILAMVFEITTQEKPKIWRLLIFLVGIITANSSAGFALAMCCVILFFIKKVNVSQNIFATFLSLLILSVGIVIVLNFDNILAQTDLGENEYMQKLGSDSIMDSSRIKAIKHNLSMFITEPIFGVGISTAFATLKHVADTSTSTYMMNIFGILGMLYTGCWIYGIIRLPKVGLLVKILLLVIILIILNKEPHHQNLMSWCILFALVEGNFADSTITTDQHKQKMPVLR